MAKFDDTKKQLYYKTWLALEKSEENWQCCICGKETYWFSLDFMTHICSEECLDFLVNEYMGTDDYIR
jgi:hypothetical protein